MMKMKSWSDCGWRIFDSPRNFQLCFSIENYQSDGFIRATIGLLKKSFQVNICFHNSKGYEFSWKLFE